MADQEAQATETKTEETPSASPETGKEAVQRSPGEMGAEIFDASPKDVSEDMGPLFDDEKAMEETDLKGEETKEPEKPAPEKKEGETPSGEEKPAETPKPKGEEKAEEKPKEEEPKKEEEKKAPEGFVAKDVHESVQKALTEERKSIKTLKAEVANLQSQLAEVPKTQIKPPESSEDAKWKDFKVLTDEEYDELCEDDLVEAQKYDRKFRQYEKYKDLKEAAEQEAKKQQNQMKSYISDTVRQISEAVPGIYDDGSETPIKLVNFAKEHGFEDEHYLEAMTNPETLIIPSGEDKPFLIGPGAIGLIKLLHNLHSKTSVSKEDITKELEPKIREQVTKELLSKMKGTEKDKFRSLTEVPGSESAPDESSRVYTEEEWAKLPEEKREQLLRET